MMKPHGTDSLMDKGRKLCQAPKDIALVLVQDGDVRRPWTQHLTKSIHIYMAIPPEEEPKGD